jgi:hypothetical protein
MECWKNKQFAGRVAVGVNEPLPPRESLGDNDPAQWDVGPDGYTKRDPWQEVHWLPLRRMRDGVEFAFSTTSKGGRRAIANLVKAGLSKKGLDPVVELASDGYDHPNKQLGWINTPYFRPCGWKPYASDVSNGVGQLEAPKTDVVPIERAPTEEKANTSLFAGADPDDDLPF